MSERERDRRDEERGHIVNPAHPLADEVADGLRQLRNEELAALAHQDKIAAVARPTQEERRSIAELYEPAAQALGIDLERLVQRHRDVGENELVRIKGALEGNLQRPPKRVALDHERGANLRGADLRNADLHGASLLPIMLKGADVRGAFLDSDTIMPDSSERD